ncbi:phage antirepressor N-terminal domain-containing protein [Serratia quinivorans]|uniref:phage antirepressor N-terminal domain-containing protein n=1 Tax=Serratia quinivorans TaxID=137545 RepID=UPI002E765F2E|nr:phage antirepressor N-terminal domain-containing protein [Serratia quinivorans]
MTNQPAITVPFHGNTLFIINHNDEPYAPMKPIVEGMGMDWASQFTKLKQRFKSTVVEITMVAEDGKPRRMICLALRKLAGWLNTISPNKVKPEIRDKVIQYQNECDDVLYEYWTTGEVKRKNPVKPQPKILCRYHAAVTIWDKLTNRRVILEGDAHTIEQVASGISTDLGYEPISHVKRKSRAQDVLNGLVA